MNDRNEWLLVVEQTLKTKEQLEEKIKYLRIFTEYKTYRKESLSIIQSMRRYHQRRRE